MPAHRKLLHVFSLIVVLSMLFSGLALPAASAQEKDGLKRQVNPQTGKVSFLSPESGRVLSAAKALGAASSARPSDPGMALAKRFGPEFGLKNPARELRELKTNRSEDGRMAVRYQQNYEGIPVMGAELIVNTNRNGDLYSINGEVSPDLSLATQPSIDAEQARQTALQGAAKWYGKSPEDFVSSEPALWIFDESLLQPSDRPAELVWRMEVTPMDTGLPVRELVLVNAERGSISLRFNQIDTAWGGVEKEKILPILSLTHENAGANKDYTVTNSPANSVQAQTGTIWYVATTGNDSNSCSSPAAPCATINGAITKAGVGETIKIAVGTYTGSGTEVVLINKNVTLSGGWDNAFSTQNGSTVIDGQGVRRGVVINSGVTAFIDHLIIQNGFHSSQGGGIYNYGNLTVNNSLIKNNLSEWMGGGIYNNGTLTVNDTAISANKAGRTGYGGGGGGAGISNAGGTVTVNHSEIKENAIIGAFSASGIDLNVNAIVILNGTTVRNNTGAESIHLFGGQLTLNNSIIDGHPQGGIRNGPGQVSLNNSLISNNSFGISSGGYSNTTATLQNSIVAQNTYFDCSGTITSNGHNLIGKTSSCTFTPVAGDLTNIDPRLSTAMIGTPPYRVLVSGSPAIDAGDPATCLATDQRGVSRPQGNVCDIGTFEYQGNGTIPAYILPFSGTPQYLQTGAIASSVLKAVILDEDGDTVPGKPVTFTSPESGARAVFVVSGYTNILTVATDANGIADSGAIQSNTTAGSYIIKATVEGLAASADFIITNGALVQTYSANNTSQLPGTFLCGQYSPNCTNGNNPHADSAQQYAIGTYTFYLNEYGRHSFDNNGMRVVSTVHYQNAYDNSFWDGEQMVYGDRYGYPLADDVVAHEFTHGVTQYESNLFYYYQSGAINESFSDLWGEYYDQTNGLGNDAVDVKWVIGEDAIRMRLMSHPPYYSDPDKMSSTYYYEGDSDNGGVHTNSGINNKAVFLMVDGGSFNGKTVPALGWEKTGAIYYEANTNLLTSGADYSDLYYTLQQACSNLIGQQGITSADCAEVKDAIDAVEMNSQPASNFNTDASYCSQGEPVTTIFYDDLESGTGNWTFSNGAYPRWQLDSPYGPYAHSGEHSLYADDYPDLVTDASAILIPVAIPGRAYLHFAHAYDFEVSDAYYDGGVLEYSANGGSTWTDAGSLIEHNGYKATLFTGAGNPLSGRSAFAGASHGYISTRVNLATLAGKNVIFRWRMGLDQMDYAWGWWVDDVRIYQCPPSGPVEPGIYDDSHSAWSYSGMWTTYNGSGPFNNTMHQINTQGSYAELAFNGAQVMLGYLKAPGRGSINVYIDGTKVDTINASNTTVAWQSTWLSPAVSQGNHKIRFENAGDGWIDLDAVQVFAADPVAPAAITTLAAVSGTGNGKVNLSWTAVGDDANTGTATAYVVRYSTSQILTQTDWDNATVVSSGIPTPQTAGQAESMLVSGLTAGQTYYFAVRARDEQSNLGGLSNSPSAAASIVLPASGGVYDDAHTAWTYVGNWATYNGSGPYSSTLHQNNTMGDYAEVTFDGIKISLTYLEAPGRGLIDVYIDGTKVDTITASSTGVTWQASWTSQPLTEAVHTVKFVNAGSGWMDLDAIEIFEVDTTAPAAISTLSAVTGSGNGMANLSWTAVSDDGNTPGRAATTYLVRYSTSAILTETDWDNATVVSSGIPTPKTQGQAETMTVGGLTAGQTYYFAVRARDEQSNLGGLSNSPSAAASSAPATPAGIYDDAHAVWTYSGTWPTYSGNGPYNNTLHQNSMSGNYAEVTFDGIKISLTYLKAPGRGLIDVYIDGTKVDTINAGSTGVTWQATWTSQPLTAAAHTVRFVNPGSGWIDLDAIQIYAPPTPVGAGVYDDAHAAWTYSGTWPTYSGSGPYNNTLHQNNTLGNYAEVMFTGTKVSLTYLKAPGRGPIDIYIDGTKVDTIDAGSTGVTWQASWISQALTNAAHTVRFVNAGGSWIDLDAVQVYEADTTAPAAITTVAAATGSGHGMVNLSWTAVGDDGTTGTATTYLVRYSTSAILTQTDWDNATVVNSGIPTPKLQGQAESMTVGGLTAGQTYYFAVRARDEQSNLGGLSNSPSAVASSAPAVGAGAYDDTDSAWNYVGSWTTYSGPGPYNNSLHQSSATGSYAEVIVTGAKISLVYLKAPGRGSIDIYIDGSKADTINTSSTGVTWQAAWTSQALSAGAHTVRFENAGGGWIDLDALQVQAPVGAGTYDDADSAWSYAGLWTTYTGSGPYNNTLHQNNTQGNYAELTFTGTNISLTYLKAPGRGSIDVYIDGTKVDTISASSTGLAWQSTWMSQALSAGVHKVRFENASGGWIDLDAVTVQE